MAFKTWLFSITSSVQVLLRKFAEKNNVTREHAPFDEIGGALVRTAGARSAVAEAVETHHVVGEDGFGPYRC